LAIGVISR